MIQFLKSTLMIFVLLVAIIILGVLPDDDKDIDSDYYIPN